MNQKISVLRAVIVTCTYLLPTILVDAALSSALSSMPDLLFYTLIGGLLLVCYLLYTLFWVRIVDKRSWSVLKLQVNRSSILGFCKALGLTASIVCFGTLLSHFAFGLTLEPRTFTVSSVIIALISSFLVQGFPEEVVFRGYITQTLACKPSTSILVSAGLFGLMHIFHLANGLLYGLFTVIFAFVFGLLAGVLRHVFQTTWAAVAVHGGLHITRKLLEMGGFSYTDVAQIVSTLLMLAVVVFLWKRCFSRQADI